MEPTTAQQLIARALISDRSLPCDVCGQQLTHPFHTIMPGTSFDHGYVEPTTCGCPCGCRVAKIRSDAACADCCAGRHNAA
jgi:hypothetical protein